jgi:hypothetical protein
VRTTFAITDPDNVSCTMQITMTLAQWKLLRESLNNRYPDWKIREAIDDLVAKANDSFAATVESER